MPHSRLIFVLCLTVPASACLPRPPAAYCTLGDGKRLDVAGRADGVYGIIDGRVAEQPLFGFDRIVRTAEGVEPSSGKPLLRFRIAEPEATRFASFTQAPAGRGIAVVVGGEVACAHKLRTPTRTPDIQLSCCNPAACERWKALVRGP